MSGKIRRNEIHSRRKRKVKLRRLRAKLGKAKSPNERKLVISKILKIHPGLTFNEA